jgi:hypothetical protein
MRLAARSKTAQGQNLHQRPAHLDWGLGGAIPGYQSMAYWNQGTGRTVVLASTMDPAPAAALAPLANAAAFALCGPQAARPSARPADR